MRTKLQIWLDAEKGRYTDLAEHLGLSLGRVSQIASSGVPKRYLRAVRDFTGGELTLEDLIEITPVRDSTTEAA